jgi:hypothetical protein
VCQWQSLSAKVAKKFKTIRPPIKYCVKTTFHKRSKPKKIATYFLLSSYDKSKKIQKKFIFSPKNICKIFSSHFSDSF